MSKTSEEIVEDDYGNLRYIGADPNNYVNFNCTDSNDESTCEKWRIIGVMKDIKNADGTVSDKVKLIRSEKIGSYAWSNVGFFGNNNWSRSALKKVLNEGAYYNRTSGDCPNGYDGATTSCDFSETGLTVDAKNMISVSMWSLGGGDVNLSYKAVDSYLKERGTTVYSGNATKWTGRVGLMYPSDYGYATAGGVDTTSRKSCLSTNLSTSNYWNGGSKCYINDWLFKSDESQWTLMPGLNSSSVFYVEHYGAVHNNDSNRNRAVYPVVYLDSKIGIRSESDGSSTTPFVLEG